MHGHHLYVYMYITTSKIDIITILKCQVNMALAALYLNKMHVDNFSPVSPGMQDYLYSSVKSIYIDWHIFIHVLKLTFQKYPVLIFVEFRCLFVG